MEGRHQTVLNLVLTYVHSRLFLREDKAKGLKADPIACIQESIIGHRVPGLITKAQYNR